jgi:hypothetical protein
MKQPPPEDNHCHRETFSSGHNTFCMPVYVDLSRGRYEGEKRPDMGFIVMI